MRAECKMTSGCVDWGGPITAPNDPHAMHRPSCVRLLPAGDAAQADSLPDATLGPALRSTLWKPSSSSRSAAMTNGDQVGRSSL